jgi:predicted RNA-binding Zn-ribbon protein involved in translation (DUF1610 family)
MIISFRYKLGRCVNKPLPRCRFCGEYTVYRQSIIDRDSEFLDCPRCGATFEIRKGERE